MHEEVIEVAHKVADEVHGGIVAGHENEHEHEVGQEAAPELKYVEEVEGDIWVQTGPDVKHHGADAV